MENIFEALEPRTVLSAPAGGSILDAIDLAAYGSAAESLVVDGGESQRGPGGGGGPGDSSFWSRLAVPQNEVQVFAFASEEVITITVRGTSTGSSGTLRIVDGNNPMVTHSISGLNSLTFQLGVGKTAEMVGEGSNGFIGEYLVQ